MDALIKPFGLNNFSGAACWYNSMLQSLLGCEPLIEYLLKHQSHYMKMPFARKFCTLMVSDQSVESGIPLWEDLVKKKRQVSYGQQDSTEFFTDFLELFNSQSIIDMFTYITRSSLHYDGKVKESEKHENIVMSLTPEAMSMLQRHLNHEIEIIEGYKPDDTKEYTTSVYKITRLTRAPPVLAIMIKNYNSISTRSVTFDYPTSLVFNDHTDDMPTITYELTSLIEHHGSKSMGGGGHYICYSKRGDTIYCFNDSSVGKAARWPINYNVYMLLYSVI